MSARLSWYNMLTMLRKSRKQVTCRHCGFLALLRGTSDELDPFKPVECTQKDRNHIAGDVLPPMAVTCARHVWSYFDYTLDYAHKPEELLNMLNSNRKCVCFFPHHPGYSPVEHRELQREAKNQRLLIIGMVLAAVVGAVASAIVTWLIAT